MEKVCHCTAARATGCTCTPAQLCTRTPAQLHSRTAAQAEQLHSRTASHTVADCTKLTPMSLSQACAIDAEAAWTLGLEKVRPHHLAHALQIPLVTTAEEMGGFVRACRAAAAGGRDISRRSSMHECGDSDHARGALERTWVMLAELLDPPAVH